MICVHQEAGGDLAGLLGLDEPPIPELLRAMASRGGRPGNACLVLTDTQNLRWFYGPGDVLPASERLATLPPESPHSLARELPEVVRRVRPECAACARALLDPPRGHLPVYGRIGPEASAIVASMPFPAELEALAQHAPNRGENIELFINGKPVGAAASKERTEPRASATPEPGGDAS